MAYTVITTDGAIVQTCFNDTSSADYPLKDSQQIINIFCDNFNSYWNGEEFVPFPPKLNEFSLFNYKTKEWEDPRTIEELKSYRWEEIKKLRNLLESSGFEYKGVLFDSDPNSQTKLLNFITMGIPVTWTLKDNSTIDLTVEDLNNLKVVLANHITSVHERSRLAREKIEQASTKEEVDAVVL